MKKRYIAIILTVVLILGISVLDAAAKVILGHFDLQFRPWVELVSYIVRCALLLFLIGTGVFVLGDWLKGVKVFWHKLLGGIAMLGCVFILFGMLLGAVFFGALSYKKESIAELEDKKCLVCENKSWMHTSWSYYEYKGWFFMGEDLMDYKMIDK